MRYVLEIPSIVYRDINAISEYIALDNPAAAKKTARKLFTVIESLQEGPLAGFELRRRFNINTDLRGRIVKPYIVLFKLEKNLVKIYRILDCRSDYLARLGLMQKADERNEY